MSHAIQLRGRMTRVLGLFLVIILIFGLKSFPLFVEEYYSSKVYPLIRRSLQFVFNIFSFSVGDILYLLIIFIVVAYFVRILQLIIIKRKAKEAAFVFLGLVINIEIAFILFYLFWGLNYFREPASNRLRLVNIDYNLTELRLVSSILVDSANSSRASLRYADLHHTGSFGYEPSIRAVKNLSTSNSFFWTPAPMVKSSMFSTLLNYMGTAGYYNPFTGEAQVNGRMPAFLRPFIACHEMAHQTGYAAEDEANFAGFLTGIRSDDRLLKYSSYYLATQEFLAEVWRVDTVAFKVIKAKISKSVMQDFKTEKEYWTKYQGNAAKLSSIFYDNYLKVNKQPEGLKTYNRMVKLTMAYYKKNGLIKSKSFNSLKLFREPG